MRNQRSEIVNAAFNRILGSLNEPIIWFPLPMFISFGLILILTSYELNATNPRAGNPANIINYPSSRIGDVPIWISVTPIGDDIVITTSKRKIFRWNRKAQSTEKLQNFINDVRLNAELELTTALLSQHKIQYRTTAVIAVDQNLNYSHLRPIIMGLAEAGIRKYAFETNSISVGVD